MKRKGDCDQCGATDVLIHKTLPSSGRYCGACNDTRLKNMKSSVDVKNKSMKTDKINMPSVKDLIKHLDKVYSQHMRQKFADPNGFVKCATCEAYNHWSEMDLGHYISRGTYIIRWDERNTHPQCRVCNQTDEGQLKKGRPEEFARFIDKTYGAGTSDHLNAIKHKDFKLDPLKLKELIEKYS
jgi:hypothetical protein